MTNEQQCHCRASYTVEGIVLIILGILAIALPKVMTFALVMILGWILVIRGIFHLYRALRNFRAETFWLSLINSLLALAIGILLLIYPLHGILFLTLMLGIFFLFEGIIEIGLAIRLKSLSANWGWLLCSGILALILSAIIWSGWPKNSVWILSILLGINLIFYGFSLIFFASSRRETLSL